MRNVFDQYKQPENRLSHALLSTLHNEPRLIRPFLRWLGVRNVPPFRAITVGQQQPPDAETGAEAEREEPEGVPDGCFFDDRGWAVLIESKVQAKASVGQLRRHRRTAARYGYDDALVVLLAVDPPSKRLPDGMRFVPWREVYGWFSRRAGQSDWAGRFVEYMQVFESKMLTQEYDIRGTLTMFSGFRFDEDNPYTYREGKRLIRLMGQAFRRNRRLVRELGLDPQRKGRSSLTKGEASSVWDFIPLKEASDSYFTAFPHATMVVRPTEAAVGITVPNGLKGGIKRRLRSAGLEQFAELLAEIEKRLRPTVRKLPGTKPMMYVVQRHYRTQRSHPEQDGRIDVDLRTLVPGGRNGLKHQPMWVEAVYGILVRKRTNIQMGIEAHIPYTARIMQTAKALDAMADAWVGLKPVLRFVLGSQPKR